MMRIRVWDPVVRLFHWSLVLSFAVVWLSANRWEDLHIWAGYVAGALILVRVTWGLVGTRYARFANFLCSPRRVLTYLRAIIGGSEPRHVGHNPAGGAMILALILAIGSTVFTGWMATTDTFWGVTWVQNVHDLLAHGALLLIGFHIAGVVLASYRHRENLIAAMISGKKRPPDADDID